MERNVGPRMEVQLATEAIWLQSLLRDIYESCWILDCDGIFRRLSALVMQLLQSYAKPSIWGMLCETTDIGICYALILHHHRTATPTDYLMDWIFIIFGLFCKKTDSRTCASGQYRPTSGQWYIWTTSGVYFYGWKFHTMGCTGH